MIADLKKKLDVSNKSDKKDYQSSNICKMIMIVNDDSCRGFCAGGDVKCNLITDIQHLFKRFLPERRQI